MLTTVGVWRASTKPIYAPTLTWLELSKPAVDTPIPRVSPRTLKGALSIAPPKLAQTPPSPITPLRSDELAALRAYVWCGALDEGKQLSGSAKPCDKVNLNLHQDAAPTRAPTEQEKSLTRQFDRDLAVARAPVLLPCFGGGGVSIMCLMEGALNGFEYTVGSYAGNEASKCDSRFAGAEPCARNYSLQSFAPTNKAAGQ